MVKKKVLLFGDTGKIGTAIKEVFSDEYVFICKNSKNCIIEDQEDVEKIIKIEQPDIVINAVVYGGIDQCEINPEKAFQINTLFPKLLAELSFKFDFLLVHFSSEAVFSDNFKSMLDENTPPTPVNMYGFTKYGADIYVSQKAKKYYIFRIPIQFGNNSNNTQFIEKMLQKVLNGQREFNIADDVVSMPAYSIDTALKVKEIIENKLKYGIYHISSKEKATLYDLFCSVIDEMDMHIEIKIHKASHKDFDSKGHINTFVMMTSSKISSIRSYKESVKDYCNSIKRNDYGR